MVPFKYFLGSLSSYGDSSSWTYIFTRMLDLKYFNFLTDYGDVYLDWIHFVLYLEVLQSCGVSALKAVPWNFPRGNKDIVLEGWHLMPTNLFSWKPLAPRVVRMFQRDGRQCSSWTRLYLLLCAAKACLGDMGRILKPSVSHCWK